MSNYLSAPHFHDEAAAFKFVEDRVWPTGPVCPHCGSVERIGKLEGKSTRLGVYKCYACRKPFTVRVGTIFEDSHIELQAVAASDLPDCIVQEGDQQQPASSHFGHHPQVSVVPVAPYPARDGWRRGQARRAMAESWRRDETYIGRSPDAKKARYRRQAQTEHHLHLRRASRPCEVHSHHRQELCSHQARVSKSTWTRPET